MKGDRLGAQQGLRMPAPNPFRYRGTTVGCKPRGSRPSLSFLLGSCRSVISFLRLLTLLWGPFPFDRVGFRIR